MPGPAPEPDLEQDSRFPTGPWTGFYLQAELPPGRHPMDLHLTFRSGTIRGEGHDRLGHFLVIGRYELGDGSCRWAKRYVGRHDVSYRGFNEGKGIWGTWQIPPTFHGGFHIWPTAGGDPSGTKLAEALEIPIAEEAPAELATAGEGACSGPSPRGSTSRGGSTTLEGSEAEGPVRRPRRLRSASQRLSQKGDQAVL